ncbi:hypothetical protein [Streptomyces antarcticus]|uniref:hypothetical protein n=1 Tax=Streptomyces antarcticus TaxID=2996458 RepID=UPI00226F24EF|nr:MULTISPECIES: hypothetical protein [unclassified Streptomyces]MCY0946471.1 hypothetical protein [Streptomyces sp. H34-AA3]MCZ4082676.1 hypothetical protein [Streptomyces sp. H34-S5]
MSTAREDAIEDRAGRRLAWCVALVLRHAPDHVAAGLLGRLDGPARKYLTRDEWLPASAVTLLLRHGTAQDRHYIARNPRVVGRPLPGLPGPARYAARPGPSPELLAEAGPGPFGADELLALLRRHGRRPRVPLTLLRMPHDPLDPGFLVREHARTPLPPGAVEALLLVGGLPPETAGALLDAGPQAGPGAQEGTGAQTGPGAQGAYGPSWHRPAVRAVRMGLLTFEELVAHVAPAHRTLLLAEPAGPPPRGLRWNLSERTGMRTAVARALRPLGDDPRLWAELLRHARTAPLPLPELVAGLAGGSLPGPADGPGPAGLEAAVRSLAPRAEPGPRGGVERELALASLAVPMETVAEDIRWVRDCLARGLIDGADVVRHKLPACWALDEDHWLGETYTPDRHDRPGPVLTARAEADRLFALALGEDPDAWWSVARALPEFAGTLPHLLLRVTDGGSVSTRP